jgi:hypothetical protein
VKESNAMSESASDHRVNAFAHRRILLVCSVGDGNGVLNLHSLTFGVSECA